MAPNFAFLATTFRGEDDGKKIDDDIQSGDVARVERALRAIREELKKRQKFDRKARALVARVKAAMERSISTRARWILASHIEQGEAALAMCEEATRRMKALEEQTRNYLDALRAAR